MEEIKIQSQRNTMSIVIGITGLIILIIAIWCGKHFGMASENRETSNRLACNRMAGMENSVVSYHQKKYDSAHNIYYTNLDVAMKRDGVKYSNAALIQYNRKGMKTREVKIDGLKQLLYVTDQEIIYYANAGIYGLPYQPVEKGNDLLQIKNTRLLWECGEVEILNVDQRYIICKTAEKIVIFDREFDKEIDTVLPGGVSLAQKMKLMRCGKITFLATENAVLRLDERETKWKKESELALDIDNQNLFAWTNREIVFREFSEQNQIETILKYDFKTKTKTELISDEQIFELLPYDKNDGRLEDNHIESLSVDGQKVSFVYLIEAEDGAHRYLFHMNMQGENLTLEKSLDELILSHKGLSKAHEVQAERVGCVLLDENCYWYYACSKENLSYNGMKGKFAHYAIYNRVTEQYKHVTSMEDELVKMRAYLQREFIRAEAQRLITE